ncbi:hypothetical protein KCV07_g302, partial [Aureobasidium melanogenum]
MQYWRFPRSTHQKVGLTSSASDVRRKISPYGNASGQSGEQHLRTPTSTRGLLANLTGLGSIHLVISVTYLFYNHIWSRVFVAAELNAFVKTRTPLRVTLPAQGAQSTYYLSIKPHFSTLLIISLILIHFFATRALNVVAIQTYDIMGQYSHQRITYGTSAFSAIIALVLGFVMLCVLAFGMERKLHAGMPVLGTCSIAISAACHADDDSALLKVGWLSIMSSRGLFGTSFLVFLLAVFWAAACEGVSR